MLLIWDDFESIAIPPDASEPMSPLDATERERIHTSWGGLGSRGGQAG